MKSTSWSLFYSLIVSLAVAPAVVVAASVPFVEDFTTNAANWADNSAMNLLSHVATGGPDGGAYASAGKSLMGLVDQTVVLFRAQDEFNSSAHALEGDWITQRVGRFSAVVRHNAPLPLSFFTRFSGPGNFPGGTAVEFIPVLPNTWTQISFDIHASNPEFVTFEGFSFDAVFSNVGHVQVGVLGPAALNANPSQFTFDIDKVSIAEVVPETSTVLAAMIGGIVFACGRWRGVGVLD
jgi:hypothetical protein